MAIGTPVVGTLAAGADGSASPLHPALPAGDLTGNTLVLVAFCRQAGTTTIATPSGWTSRDNSLLGGHRLVATRLYQAGDTAPSVAYTNVSVNQTVMAQVIAIPGVDPLAPIDVTGTPASWTSTLNMGPVTGITTGVANAGVLVIACKQNDFTSAATLTGDSLTWSEVTEQSTLLGGQMSFVVGFAIRPTAGAITDKTFVITGSGGGVGGGIMLSLKPGAAPTVVTAVPASATGSPPAPLPKLKPMPGPIRATASRALPVPKLSVVSPIRTATASRALPVPKVKVIPGPASATASRAIPTLQTTAAKILQPPVIKATAAFPLPTKSSSGLTAVTPPASAAASRALPTPKFTLIAPKGSATASAPSSLPRLKVVPFPANATASGLVPTTRTVVLGVPVAGATAQGRVAIPKIAVGPDAARATGMGVSPNAGTGQFLARLPTHLVFARNTTTLVLEGAELALALDG